MTGSKIALAVLIVLALVFVVVLALGAHQNNSQRAPTDRNSQANYEPPSWVSGIGQLIAPLSPKLKLDKSAFTFGSQPISEPVPSSTDTFRQATFRVTQGCRSVTQPNGTVKQDCTSAQITYQSAGGEGHDLGLDSQVWKGTSNDPTRGSLVILKGGGTLTFRCVGSPTCAILLE